MKERIGMIQVVLVGLLVIASFTIGSLYTKVKYLEKGSSVPAAAPAAAQPQAPAAPTITLDQVKNVFTQSVIKFGDSNKNYY